MAKSGEFRTESKGFRANSGKRLMLHPMWQRKRICKITFETSSCLVSLLKNPFSKLKSSDGKTFWFIPALTETNHKIAEVDQLWPVCERRSAGLCCKSSAAQLSSHTIEQSPGAGAAKGSLNEPNARTKSKDLCAALKVQLPSRLYFESGEAPLSAWGDPSMCSSACAYA